MNEIVTQLSVGDVIQAAGVLVAIVASIISVAISVLTLRQNNKMIEEESRPYIVVYGAMMNVQSPNFYLVLKNFGKSGAIITELKSDDIGEFSHHPKRVSPFGHLEGSLIAPGQSIRCPIDQVAAKKKMDKVAYTIEYSWANRTFREINTVNLHAFSDIPSDKANTKDKELRTISFALQEIVEMGL